jgi:hypothetical protein
MKRKILSAAVAVAITVGAGAASAHAAPSGAGEGGKPRGVACQQYGLSVLRSLGAPPKVSQEVIGLPLSTVLALHREQPATAAAVLIGLGLPEADVVAACGAPA